MTCSILAPLRKKTFLATALLGLSGAASTQVLSVRELNSTTAAALASLDDGDEFGRSATLLGDLDGDGVVDVAVGAPNDDDGGLDRGAVYVLFLNADGSIREATKISSTSGGFQGPLDDVDLFGSSIANIGDLDNDGLPELAVGAKKDDDGDTNVGAVWVLFLNSDGTVREEAKISALSGNFGGSLGRLDTFGSSLASIGDLDQDGIDEIAVGAEQNDSGGVDAGAIWLLFLNADATVRSELRISSADMGFAVNLDPLDRFGSSVASIGDLDGDDIPDLAVGADADDDGGNNRGAVYLLFLNEDGTVRDHRKISSLSGSLEGPLADKDRFGSSLGCLGDLEGDGFFELAVGAPFDDDGGSDAGALWVLSLNRAGDVIHERKLSANNTTLNGKLFDDNLFGTSSISLGDLDQDGTPDLLIGAAGDDHGGVDQGGTWISYLGQLAQFRFYNGTGVNSACLFPENLAILGKDWHLSVTTFQNPQATSSFVIGFDQPLSGVLIPSGEILVDPTSNLLFVSSLPSAGAADTHVIPVANDIALIGRSLYAQAGILGNGLELCNGIEFCAGF